MALTHFYVDPSINADSGTGTVGDPYGDLEFCMESEDWVAAGIQVNIKAGATETIAAKLETAMAATGGGKTVAWVPTETGPLVIRGYTTAANDGGKGVISGGGAVGIFVDAALSYITLADLRLTNTGANSVLNIDNYWTVIACEIDTSTSGYAIDTDTNNTVIGCYIHDCTGTGCINFVGNGRASYNFVVTGAGNLVGINGFNNAVIDRNIVVVTATVCDGIRASGEALYVDNNSVYSQVAAGGSAGIYLQSNHLFGTVLNNLIEGWSATGGIGIEFDTNGNTAVIGGNAVYNCLTAYGGSGDDFRCYDYGDNETLSASPFTDAANNDFSPVDTGNVKEGSLPATFPGP